MNYLLKEIKGITSAVILALVIRTFCFQPFNVPSGSMYPTLLVGDYLFVTKYSYGISQYSLPFAPPLFSGRFLEITPPARGEVVVFTNPKDPSMDYVKRLIGLPGDRIQLKKGLIHINGVPINRERVQDYTMIDHRTNQVMVLEQYKETLPNGASYEILKDPHAQDEALDNTQEFFVPQGHYFMMGDNRDHSQDSRFLDKVGYIPAQYLIGPAKVLFFSTDAKWYDVGGWINGLRPSRIFKPII